MPIFATRIITHDICKLCVDIGFVYHAEIVPRDLPNVDTVDTYLLENGYPHEVTFSTSDIGYDKDVVEHLLNNNIVLDKWTHRYNLKSEDRFSIFNFSKKEDAMKFKLHIQHVG